MDWRVLRASACVVGAIVWLVFIQAVSANEWPDKTPIVVTGAAAPELKSLDDEITSLMRKWSIPGGAVAVAKDGRLVLAHGYGLADRDAGTPVQPDSLFRIASLSKPITAAAILVLVERGRLDLDAKVLDILKSPGISPDKAADPRWKQITVRQLLFHTAGFDRGTGFDPMSALTRLPRPPARRRRPRRARSFVSCWVDGSTSIPARTHSTSPAPVMPTSSSRSWIQRATSSGRGAWAAAAMTKATASP